MNNRQFERSLKKKYKKIMYINLSALTHRMACHRVINIYI